MKKYFGFILGNFIDHMDLALYSFLLPLMMDDFFKTDSKIYGLILGHSVSFFGIFIRLFFSYWAMRFLNKKNIINTYLKTLLALSLLMILIPFIPNHNSIGIFAYVFLILARLIQMMFSTIDRTLSLNICLNIESKYQIRLQSFLNFSSIFGILMAQFLSYITSLNLMTWQKSYYFIFVLNIVLICIQKQKLSSFVLDNIQLNNDVSFKKSCFNLNHLSITLSSLFSYVTYAIVFLLPVNWVSILHPALKSTIYLSNNIYMIFDAFILYFIYQVKTITHFKIKKGVYLLPFIFCFMNYFLFIFYKNADVYFGSLFRILTVIIGVMFSVLYPVHFYHHKNTYKKYYNFYHQLGSELGRSFLPIFLIIWHCFQNIFAVSLFVTSVTFFCFLCNLKTFKDNKHWVS